jgi:hypothetical protein
MAREYTISVLTFVLLVIFGIPVTWLIVRVQLMNTRETNNIRPQAAVDVLSYSELQ